MRWCASRLIEANAGALDAATPDVNLGGATSHDIAATLDAHGIPFIVTTGYVHAPRLVGFGNRPTVHKPYDTHDIESGSGTGVAALETSIFSALRLALKLKRLIYAPPKAEHAGASRSIGVEA